MSVPSRPCAPAEVHTSRGTMPSRSHWSWKGTTFFSAQARTVSRKSSCSASYRDRRMAVSVPHSTSDPAGPAQVSGVSYPCGHWEPCPPSTGSPSPPGRGSPAPRSEEHTSELQSRQYLVCRLLLEKKKKSIVT